MMGALRQGARCGRRAPARGRSLPEEAGAPRLRARRSSTWSVARPILEAAAQSLGQVGDLAELLHRGLLIRLLRCLLVLLLLLFVHWGVPFEGAGLNDAAGETMRRTGTSAAN